MPRGDGPRPREIKQVEDTVASRFRTSQMAMGGTQKRLNYRRPGSGQVDYGQSFFYWPPT